MAIGAHHVKREVIVVCAKGILDLHTNGLKAQQLCTQNVLSRTKRTACDD